MGASRCLSLRHLDHFLSHLGLALEPGERLDVDTVAGLVGGRLGRIPRVADVAEFASFRLVVHTVSGRSVQRVWLDLLAPTSEAEGPVPSILATRRRFARRGRGAMNVLAATLWTLGLVAAITWSCSAAGPRSAAIPQSRPLGCARLDPRNTAARLLYRELQHPDRNLVTLLVSNNIANYAIALCATGACLAMGLSADMTALAILLRS